MGRKLIIRDRKADYELQLNEKRAIFTVLDAIRETGKVNMFGAAVHLRSCCGEDEMTRKESQEWVKKYMGQQPVDRDLKPNARPRKLRVK